jgi:hypothetical protein
MWTIFVMNFEMFDGVLVHYRVAVHAEEVVEVVVVGRNDAGDARPGGSRFFIPAPDDG